MATYNIDKFTSPSGDVYKFQDKVSGYTTNTGTVTSVTAGTGLKIGTATSGGSITTTGTINHINSITAGTVGTSSATSGKTLAVPYITYDAQGHITAKGTHTHTITGFSTATNLVNGFATGSLRGINTAPETSYDMGQIGTNAFAEGYNTRAKGIASHAEGYVDDYVKTLDVTTETEISLTDRSVTWNPSYNIFYFQGIDGGNIGDTVIFTNYYGETLTSYITSFDTSANNTFCNVPSTQELYAYFHIYYNQTITQIAPNISIFESSTIPMTTSDMGYGAIGKASHAEGFITTASGDYSHASNEGTIAASQAQTAIGKYNIKDENDNYMFIVGNGASESNRSNAFGVLQDGNTVQFVDVKKGTTPSSSVWSELRFKEKSGPIASASSTLAKFGVSANTDGSYTTYIRGYYPIANNSNSANITITTLSNGNNWIDLESWVNVLGGHLDICSPSSGVLGFRYGGAASATATITNTGNSELATNGNFSVGGNVSTNGKTSSTQAKAGAYITTSGNIHLTGDTSTGARINFYFGKSTSVTTYFQEVTSGYLHLIGNALIIQNNILTKGTTPSADSNRTLLFVDKNGYNSQVADVLGGIWCGVNANNTSYFNIRAYRSNTSSATFGELSIQYPASGDPVCAVNCTLQAKLYNGSSATMVGSNSTSGNRVALFATPGSTTFQIGAQWGGSTYTTKSVTVSSSDIRLKENIKDTEVEALPIINQIKVREFDWKDGKHQKIGVVADELEEIDDCLAVGGGYDEDGCMNIKSVDTFYLTGYLTKGIQELSKENEELKKRIMKLETTLSKISVS